MENAKILIIDDDPDFTAVVGALLEDEHYSVITAKNRTEGMEKISNEKPELIILDVMMDEADDGFFLAQKFKKHMPKIPILMYTSISKTIGLQFGANELVPVDDFVEKPISPATLIDKVEKLLQLHYKE